MFSLQICPSWFGLGREARVDGSCAAAAFSVSPCVSLFYHPLRFPDLTLMLASVPAERVVLLMMSDKIWVGFSKNDSTGCSLHALSPSFVVSPCRFLKPAPMFLDRNFKRLAKVNNYLPPFGFRTQGKQGWLIPPACAALISEECLSKWGAGLIWGVIWKRSRTWCCRGLTSSSLAKYLMSE